MQKKREKKSQKVIDKNDTWIIIKLVNDKGVLDNGSRRFFALGKLYPIKQNAEFLSTCYNKMLCSE